MPALTQAQLGCDNVSWMAHARERYDYHANHGHTACAEQWRIQCEETWKRLTLREKRLIAKHT